LIALYQGVWMTAGKKAETSYNRIVERMHKLYNGKITEDEANEAARNLIGFCKVLLEIHTQNIQNQLNEK